MCFGGADSGQVHAAKAGVLVLLGVIVPLLVAIGLIARSWARRARAIEKTEAQGFSATTSLVRNASRESVTRSPAEVISLARSSLT
jgi:hypothetical protein